MADPKEDDIPELISWVNGFGDEPSSPKPSDKPVEKQVAPEQPAPQRLSIVEDPEPGPVEDSADDPREDNDDTDEVDAPEINSWDDLFAAPAPAARNQQETPAPPRRRKSSARKAEAGTPPPKRERPAKTRREVPTWVKPAVIGTGVLTLVGLLVGAIVVGQSFGTDYSADHTAPAQPSLDSSAGQAAATTTRDRLATDMPKDSVTVVSDGCDVEPGQERMPPSQRNLRSAYITFQKEYEARNAEGITALILPSNKEWRGQDWEKILNSVPEDYSYCMTMPPAVGTTATATIRMHMNGKDVISHQKITGRADKDGRWVIEKIEAKKD